MLVKRIRIENFRSIAACDVRLGPLTVLAGPNAAGKSNFLDALRFVRDILRSSPGHALEPRGGLEEVLHRSPTGRQADFFRIHLEMTVGAPAPDNDRTMLDASYLVEVGADPQEDGRPGIRREELSFPRTPVHVSLPRGPERQLRSEEWRENLILSKVSGRQHREASLVARNLHSMRFYEAPYPSAAGRGPDTAPTRRCRAR
ncbi:AAA family ATPase [Actinacidiphila acidipaludis]|uniref:AAA family ATPase n=1 Tax=Actinacidiphila acidipaludis TaxID=2873382 RepID=A0ABS7QEW5_9ACTN|nr:AAA family ATPase [Streptomyces acidipaludis]MBY8881690.1 AAA family ATPase [Streptomyces acidipaludis]